jgi:predicted porin
MKTVICATMLAGAVGVTASTADAQTDQPGPSKPPCFDSVWNYLKSSVRDCPLSYGPLTLYGNIDLGYGYSEWGAPVGPRADKPNFAIQRNSGNWHWLWSPNGASTSVVGIRLAQKLGDEWELIGVAETGFNPYSLQLINGPGSLVDNNLRTVPNQRSQYDTSRAGQWDNSQGFIGVSNPIYGTLTFGRTNTLVQSAIGAFDPVQSVAFSQIGFAAIYAGLGAGPTNRTNTAVTYRLTYQGFRFAFQAQAGGYDQGNAATSNYQLQVGTDIGKLSFDAVGGFAQNAVTLSTLGGAAIPAGFDPESNLRATLSNTGGIALLTRYNWDPFKFYLGYIYSLTTNPSNNSPFGLPTIASGISVPAGFVTSNNFNVPRVLNIAWTGARYAVRSNIDLAVGVYWEHQNDFLPAPAVCTGSGTATSSTRCAGDRWSYSFMVDYRPVNRISLYGGMMVSNVSGGIASGFLHTQNVDPTVGIRFRF